MIDTATGKSAGEFPSGDQPHENNYSRDGKLIYHASIGTVYTPTDDPALDDTKGERVFEVVDARTLRVLKRLDMGQKLEEAGYPNMSSAVRPMALPPDERKVYFQVSFFHGFVEYDLVQDKVLRLARLPLSRRGGGHAPRGVPARLRPSRAGHEPVGHEAVRGRDDVRLRGDRPPRQLRLQARGLRQEALLVDELGRRPLLLRVLQRRRPRRGRLLRHGARDRAACASATTRSGCGWACWPRARSACGRAPSPRRGRAGRARGCGSPCARSACAPTARCACACA